MPTKKSEDKKPLPIPEEETETRETHDLFISADTAEKKEAADANIAADLADEQYFKTKDSEGHTYNPQQAWEQGLTYTPPTDPPVLPSEDDPQGAEVAAGFAPNMEESNPTFEILPPNVDNNDLDLRDDIYLALRNNSETGHLTNVKVQVYQGMVNLLGAVFDEDDISLVHDIVQELDGVVSIKNNLQVDLRE
jgi:hypothetical protein